MLGLYSAISSQSDEFSVSCNTVTIFQQNKTPRVTIGSISVPPLLLWWGHYSIHPSTPVLTSWAMEAQPGMKSEIISLFSSVTFIRSSVTFIRHYYCCYQLDTTFPEQKCTTVQMRNELRVFLSHTRFVPLIQKSFQNFCMSYLPLLSRYWLQYHFCFSQHEISLSHAGVILNIMSAREKAPSYPFSKS